MAEEKELRGPDGRSAKVPVDDKGRPQTIKYLGRDEHTYKYMTGKFFSNVGPPKSDYRRQSTEDWECLMCGVISRYYWVKCSECNAPRGSEPEEIDETPESE